MYLEKSNCGARITGTRLSPIAFGVKTVRFGLSVLEVSKNTIPCPVVTLARQKGNQIFFLKTLFVALVSSSVRLRA